VLSFQGNSSEPTADDANRIASYVIDGYVSGSIDRVVIYYSHARNRVDQVLVNEQVLPVTTQDLIMPNQPRDPEALTQIEGDRTTVFEFEPSAPAVLGYLMPAYIRTIILHALLDSAAAEHGARRRAMQSATDNAKEVITALSRTYNRERQGSITTELNEIVAGASALEDK
jgi:F-type H+-transporting ATPase subunit gamma